LCDMLLALGPKGVLLIEDFVLGWGDASKAASSGREGLSPVRIANRLHDRIASNGYLDGHAWNGWEGFGNYWKPEGVKTEYIERVKSAMTHRMNSNIGVAGDRLRVGDPESMLDVAGGNYGWKVLLKMPGTRFNGLKDCEVAMKERLRSLGLWMPGKTKSHAMDALMHMLTFCSAFGMGNPVRPEGLFGIVRSGSKNRK